MGIEVVIDESVTWNESLHRYVELNREHSAACSSPSELPRDDLLAIGTFGEATELRSLQDDIQQSEPGRYFSSVVPSPWESARLEIIPAQVSKWIGLCELARHLGSAMANGHDELEAIVDWVCDRHDEDGLVGGVEHILARDAAGRS